MESGSGDLQRARMRELLARLDRVATVSRGHRAGLHLDDRNLADQYVAILKVWEDQVEAVARSEEAAVAVDPSSRTVGSSAVQARRK